MQTGITTLTETEAVNRILSTVGAEKVADLTNLSLIGDAAYTQLRDSLRDLQSHPWGFNTQYDVELEADGWGQIAFDTENVLTGGPSDFGTGWTYSSTLDKGMDGAPGPLGYGHAHHFGNHANNNDTFLTQNITIVDEQYYTFSVYVKYRSAIQTGFYLWDNQPTTHETISQLIITWNTDGTIASTATSTLGDEHESADATLPPLSAASYSSVGSDGWYRVVLTCKAEVGHGTVLQCQVKPNADYASSYGSTYLWGPQAVRSAYVAPYEQGRYDSKYIAAIDLAPQNAGSLDVVLRTNQFQTAGAVSNDAPMLFDRKSNSFNAFSGKYKATITYYLQYEDCPEIVKIVATAMAAVNFQASQVGNAQVDAILRQQLLAAKAAFTSYEAAQESWSIFDNYDLFKIISPAQRPTIGGGGAAWWGSR